jgi:hypothetical protein
VPNSTMDLSESLEIVEITDSSIHPDALAELDEKLPELDFTTKTKRPLSEPNLDDERSAKKICTEIEDKIADEAIVSHVWNAIGELSKIICLF